MNSVLNNYKQYAITHVFMNHLVRSDVGSSLQHTSVAFVNRFPLKLDNSVTYTLSRVYTLKIAQADVESLSCRSLET